MMINVFLSLLCAGVCTVFYRGIRFQKSLAFIGAGALLALFFVVYHHYIIGTKGIYSYQWLTSRYYPVNIEFWADAKIYTVLLVLLFVAFLNAIYMLWDKAERRKLYVFALSCLNLAALLMLICGQNTIQILISACFIDIFGFCLINNIPARRQYIFYSLLADMALYVACAMLWGNYHTNMVTEIAEKKMVGNGYALWLIVASSFIKSGLVPFQGYLMPSAVLSESRRNILYFLSTPLAGFVMLWKFYPILLSHFNGLEYLSYIAWGSLFWGAASTLFIKKLEIKKLYMNLVLYSFFYALLLQNKENLWLLGLGLLLILQMTVNNSFDMTKKRYGIACLFSIMQVCAFALVCGKIENTLLQQAYLSAVILGMGGLLYEISLSETEESHIGNILLSAGCAATTIYITHAVPENFYVILAAYIILITVRPYRLFNRIYDSETVQKSQGFSGLLYVICAGPFLFLGRILWLTVDFLIVERTLLNSIARFNEILIRLFKWLHQPNVRNVILFLMIALAIMAYSIYGRN